jgi:tetratricopeptide (TPR) repeat protein
VDQTSAGLQQAQNLIAAKRYDEALRILGRIPEDAGARLLSSVAYFFKDEPRPALVEVERSIALSPDAPEPYAFRANVLHRMGRNKRSLESAREAVRLVPSEPMFQWTLARSAAACRDWKLAELAAKETVRLAPDWSMAHEIVGLVAAGRRRRKEAQAHFRNALRLDPNDPEILHNVAVTMPRLRPRTETVRLLEEAVRLDPSDKHIADNLYIEASGHVHGGGFDRLDIFLGGPTIVFALLTLAFLTGWIPVPSLVADAVAGVFVPLMVAYAVADFVRNRRRLRSLKVGTRLLYFGRFYREHWLSVAYFLVVFSIPVILFAIVGSAVGLPTLLIAAIVVAAFPVWVALWPRIRRARLNRWLPGSK